MAREAVDTFGVNQQFRLHVRADDVELMECIVRELGLEATVTGDFCEQIGEAAASENNHLGGTVATTADGRIRLTNTLQTRLQRVANLYRAQIAEIIFDDTQEG